jgi:hypothetical protein
MLKKLTYAVTVALVLVVLPAHGQRKADIGFMTAIPWYLGDISPVVPMVTAIPPAIGPILRFNFNQRNSLRFHAVYHELAGSGEIYNGEPAEFQSSFVALGLDFEFNWWPYKTAWRKTKYSPYVSAGLGYSVNLTGISDSHVYLPFGGGIKANLATRLSGGVEVNMRKAFTDMIDGVENVGDVNSVVGNNDWYFFTGVFLTYKIFEYRDECPTYQKEMRPRIK